MKRVVAAVALAGCMQSPAPAKVEETSEVKASAEAKAEAEAEPEKPAKKIPVLTEEDKRLIAADPKELTPEDRRKRAHALRRKIMQNPDSPTARALEDMAEAVRKGEVDPTQPGKKKYPTLYLPGTKPNKGPPPAGYRPDPKAAETKRDPVDGRTRRDPARFARSRRRCPVGAVQRRPPQRGIPGGPRVSSPIAVVSSAGRPSSSPAPGEQGLLLRVRPHGAPSMTDEGYAGRAAD